MRKAMQPGDIVLNSPPKGRGQRSRSGTFCRGRALTVTGGSIRDPLAVSYRTGTPRRKRAKKRYDYVVHSPRWRGTNCEYPYGESIAASSDHSALIAE
jgi:hypothetical protein